MQNIAQKVLGVTSRMIIIASLIQIGSLAISSAQAGSSDCPCFSATIIDASFQELGGSGVRAIESNTGGSAFCFDDDGGVLNTFFSFRNEANTVSLTVFSETNSDGTFACGWSGRPLEPITSQQARSCSSEIKQSAAWRILACPKNVNPY